jgi:uncharacterized glyoxalase superfamily protein PhnB
MRSRILYPCLPCHPWLLSSAEMDCPMSGHGREACACLEVLDTDAVFEEWGAKVAICAAPKNEEWGARSFSVIDPFGNTLFVVGPIK